ncbi:MAG: hypothetical protein ACFFG0_56775 [Candidatus Thorarchaeota archaeon]
MKNKFSIKTQTEIDALLERLQEWKEFFEVKTELFFDGWAISLREKSAYPRSIVIFRSYDANSYSIKSFEILFKNYHKEEYNELYSIDNINNINSLVKEIREIIYGKDLIKEASKIYNDTFSN